MHTIALVLAVSGLLAPEAETARPVFGDAFWAHWGDGHAEISTYDLQFPRYGEVRSGTAVAIFVTETFSDEARVKADKGRHPAADQFPVMKLNLVRDFPTGIYDYNLMSSVFYAVPEFRGRPAGSPMKVSFSSQEWCGQVYHQLLPDERVIRSVSHSYFDGEADRSGELDYPEDGILEDGLFHWARGFAAPRLEPGQTDEGKIIRSLDHARFAHEDPAWQGAELARVEGTRTVNVPAGSFEVEERTVAIQEGPTWTFLVEAAPPHRLIAWSATDGRKAELVASERLRIVEDPPQDERIWSGRLG